MEIENVTYNKFNKLDRITHILILKSSYSTDIGLLEGEMGIAIAFAHLSRYTNNDVYYECMSDLLDDVLGNIFKGLNYSFKSGLSGIGWCIEYLIQNKFVEGDSLEICEEIDSRIMEVNPKRILDTSMEDGFEGLLHYIIYHLQGAIKQKNRLPFDREYLLDVFDACRSLKKKDICSSFESIIDSYELFIKNNDHFNYNLEPTDFILDTLEVNNAKLSSYPLGLSNGLAGELLKLITK